MDAPGATCTPELLGAAPGFVVRCRSADHGAAAAPLVDTTSLSVNHSPFARRLGATLWRLRACRDLGHADVVRATGGLVTISTLISYENGTRAIRAEAFSALCRTYQVSAQQVLSPVADDALGADPGLVVNLRVLRALAPERAGPLLQLSETVLRLRGRTTPAVLALRARDLPVLAALYGCPPQDLLARLDAWGVLGPGAPRPS